MSFEKDPLSKELRPNAEEFRRDLQSTELSDDDLAQFRSGPLDPTAEEQRLREYFKIPPSNSAVEDSL